MFCDTFNEKLLPRLNTKITSYAHIDEILELVRPGEMQPNAFSVMMLNYHVNDADDEYDMTRDDAPSHRFSESYMLNNVIPAIVQLAMMAGGALKKVEKSTNSIKLSRVDVASVIACAWFGLKIANLDLAPIYNRCNLCSFDSIVNYFNTIRKRAVFSGDIIIIRRNITSPPDYRRLDVPLGKTMILPADSKYQHSSSNIVLQEIERDFTRDLMKKSSARNVIFNTHPELLIICACEKISQNCTDTSALAIMGVECFSTVEISKLQWVYTGGAVDRVHIMRDGTISRVMVLVDATTNGGNFEEYTTDFKRDLSKILCGLSIFVPPRKFTKVNITFAANQWGASHGCNEELKFIQMYIAASMLNTTFNYYPADDSFLLKVKEFVKNNKTVGEVCTKYHALASEINRDVLNQYNVIPLEHLSVFAHLNKTTPYI